MRIVSLVRTVTKIPSTKHIAIGSLIAATMTATVFAQNVPADLKSDVLQWVGELDAPSLAIS